MQIILLSSISIGPRQRKKMEPSALVELENSILKNGLIHPPTFRVIEGEAGKVYQLVAGERRTRAIQKIAEKKLSFTFEDRTISPGYIPILTLKENLSNADRKEVEYAENKWREELPWQDEAEALAEIHRLRLSEDITSTAVSTAQELIASGTIVSASPQSLAIKIRQATVISENLNDPAIAKARNATEAYNLILKKDEEAVNAALYARRLATSPSADGPPPIQIRLGDARTTLTGLDEGIADLILCDPPFGIGADVGGFRQRTVHHHNYQDTPEIAREIAQIILLEGFRITKPMANIFMFCDIDLFMVLREMAGRVGWMPFRTPIIWQKSHSEGMAPWQAKGFRRTYEMIFWATKGQRGLISSPVDILDHRRVPPEERLHAAQKPETLLRQLIECSTLPGDFVLDPCCGSGSTLVAAKNGKRRGLGIEVDQTFFNTAMSNVFGEKEPAPEKATVEDLA